MDVSVCNSEKSRGKTYSAFVSDRDFECLDEMIMREVAKQIANKIVEESFGDIVAYIDPKAIANMAIASAGAKINETLNKKMPDKILEIKTKGDTEVWQRGIFGGMKRI